MQAYARAALAQRVGCGDPVARVTGYYNGYCVIRPLIPGVILPIGTVFYTNPPAAVTDADKRDAVRIDWLENEYAFTCDSYIRLEGNIWCASNGNYDLREAIDVAITASEQANKREG